MGKALWNWLLWLLLRGRAWIHDSSLPGDGFFHGFSIGFFGQKSLQEAKTKAFRGSDITSWNRSDIPTTWVRQFT
jgi:hypothetical protein